MYTIRPNKDELIQYIKKNIPQHEIANIYGVSQATVSNWFKHYNLKSEIKTGGANNIKDLTGRIFNNLKVIKYSHTGSHGKEYICECVCGNVKTIRGSVLTSGKIIGCGCSVGKSNLGNKYTKNINKHIGETHNNLTIIGIDDTKSRINYVICKCICGNITKNIYSEISSGKVKSCGCYQKELASITGSTIGLNNFHSKYKWYFIKNNVRIRCRSGFEVLYANYLIANNIDFLYEPKSFKLENGKRYTPDFYLICENKYIEIKGSLNIPNAKRQQDKTDIFSKNNNWQILFWEDIVFECDLPYKAYHTYLRKARKLNISEEDYLAKGNYL